MFDSHGDDWSLRFWDRGGAPWGNWSSNQLEAERLPDGRVRARYTKTRVDRKKPPYKVEVFELAIPREQFTLLELSKDVFVGTYYEELDLKVGDATKVTIAVSSKRDAQEKTFYERLPRQLDRLGAAATALMARCEHEGTLVQEAPQ